MDLSPKNEIVLERRSIEGCDDLEIPGTVRVFLTPPYNSCLDFRYNRCEIASASPKNMALMLKENKDFISSVRIEFPSIENVVIPGFRQGLAAGRLKSFMLDEDGTCIDIPASFWRTEKAENALTNKQLMSMNIDGTRHLGRLFMSFEDLRNGWKKSYDQDDAPKLSQVDLQFTHSPYIEFLIAASKHLGLIDGKQKDGSRLKIAEVEHWLTANWPEGLGKSTPRMVRSMATLLRHPDATRGGNIKTERPVSLLRIGRQRSRPENNDI